MILKPQGREWYRCEITTEPAVDEWEASFDDGASWHAQTLVEGFPAWKVAGAAADQGAAVAVLASSVVPLLRATTSDEDIVREGPEIFVQ